MPTYTFRNNDTGEEHTTVIKIAERDEFLKNNPNFEQLVIGVPTLGYHYQRAKPSSLLNEKFKAIKKSYKGSTVEVE